MKSIAATPRNIFYLNVLLVACLFSATMFLVRDAVSRHFEKDGQPRKEVLVSSDYVAADRKMLLVDYMQVMKNNPFGFDGGEIKPLAASRSTGSSGQTDLKLIGTVVGPKALSYAIFRDSAGMQEIFKIGDAVFGMGKLSGVERERVIVRKDASVLEIPIEDVTVKEIDKQPSAAGPSLSSFAQRVGRSSYIVNQQELQQAIANPGQMMTDARLRPNVVNGREQGFVLSEVKTNGIYQSLGLQNGDVLLRINEYDISDPEKALQAFTALKGLDRVQVDLIRSGAKMTMTYQIK